MSNVQAIQSLEARLVWLLAIMPRSISLSTAARSDEYPSDLLRRIDTLEHLLTGHFLPESNIPSPPPSEQRTSSLKYDGADFWYQLGRFTSIHDDGAAQDGQQYINDSLSAMRGILGMMENRDVLYSLAIARHFGGRLAEFRPRQRILTTRDPNDDVYKLEVARDFIETEDQKGTTQVIQRICGMAIRSWILQKQ